MKIDRALPIIAIVIPAFNESKTIGSVVKAIPDTITVSKKHYAIQTIVVNDGSTDETAHVILRTGKAHIINHILNSGAGAATRTGLVYAKQLGCVAAATMDADGQHDTNDILKVIKAVINGEGDLVIGSRLINSAGMPWYRRLGNKGLSFITLLLFGVFVTDSQSGMRCMNAEALTGITFHNNGFAFCSEILWRAQQQGMKIKEIPVKAIYTEYSLSKGQSNWGAITIIEDLLKRRFLEFIHG